MLNIALGSLILTALSAPAFYYLLLKLRAQQAAEKAAQKMPIRTRTNPYQ
jgi:hypothetical protein